MVKELLMRFDVLTAFSIKIMVFWNVKICSLVDSTGRCVPISQTTQHHISEHHLKKIHVFIKRECSLSHSQTPAIGLISEPVEASPYPHSLFL
jgi:uncharacterized membrane protein